MSNKVVPIRIPKLDLSGSVAPFAMPLPSMPASVWTNPEQLRSEFQYQAQHFFQCDAVLAVTGIESGISGLARLFQTWYGPLRVVLAEPSFEQWDARFRRSSHVVLDWPVEEILAGEIPECDVVVLGRPVNPTGQIIDTECAKTIAKNLRRTGGWLILDEAYIDWSEADSYCALIEEVPAIVLRSVAPFSGLAGVNLAFVCAPEKVCRALTHEVGTQAVSAPQWWLAIQYFNANEWRTQQRQQLKAAVERLSEVWSSIGIDGQHYMQGGYFLTLAHPKVPQWAYRLEEAGVLVRNYEFDENCWLRCAIPRAEEDWQRLAQQIAKLK